MKYKYIDDNGEHLHTLDNKPLIGTSSVADVLSKAGLTWWAAGLAVKEFGCPDPKVLTLIKNGKATEEQQEAFRLSAMEVQSKIRQMDEYGYMKLIDKAYRAHASTLKDKAKEGTDLHAELERFIKDEMRGEIMEMDVYHERIHPLIEWSRKKVKKHLWSEVYCYSEKHWTGGISDWGIEMHDGTVAVVDFKSAKQAYMSMFWQACGYALQIEENGGFDKDGNKIFDLEGKIINQVIIVPFGMDNPIPQVNIDVAGGKEAFLAELLLYKKLPRD